MAAAAANDDLDHDVENWYEEEDSLAKSEDGKSNDDDLDELEIGIMVKDFEQYIDNLPNPLFINSVTSKQVKLDQYGVQIKPKYRHSH